MANIDGAIDHQRPTIRDFANSRRISRARFIGNMMGVLLILVLLEQLVIFVAVYAGASPLLVMVVAPPTGSTFYLPSAGVALFFGLLFLLFFLDLGIRRRHDRDRSGVDVIVWAEIYVGALVLFLFGPPHAVALPELPGGKSVSAIGWAFTVATPEQWVFVGVLLVIGLRLLGALLFMPGTRGPNRYGEDPRDMLRRAAAR